MLVLSRKPGEKIHIDSGIVLEVLEITGTRVRLGFQAPERIQILRGELLARLEPQQPDRPTIDQRAAGLIPAG